MRLPFSASEFLQVLRDYNEATWPAAVILPFVGFLSAWFLLSERRGAWRMALALLGALWAWMAVVYHFTFFARINPAARAFGVAAIVQAGIFVFAAFTVSPPRSRRLDAQRAIGGALIAFALIVYPVLGIAAGHRYPLMPTFGLPCPTTIFTLGVLAVLHDELSWQYSVIPLLWAGIGTSAAFELGMIEDFSLGASGVIVIGLMAARRAGRFRGSAGRSNLAARV